MTAVKPGCRRFVAMILMVAPLLLVAACASPALSLYTLEPSDSQSKRSALGKPALVIEVRRVALPDYLDSQDILVRDGTRLERSSRGRWASRLSISVTHYLTEVLAARRPEALITDQPQVGTPNDRILIAISTLDVTRAGTATLEADWTIVPRNPAQPERRQRGRFTASGPVATDQDVVMLVRSLLTQLADGIDVAKLR